MGIVPITILAIVAFVAGLVASALHLRVIAGAQRACSPACCWRSCFHIYAARLHPGEGCSRSAAYASAFLPCTCSTFSPLRVVRLPVSDIMKQICRYRWNCACRSAHFRIIAGSPRREKLAASLAAASRLYNSTACLLQSTAITCSLHKSIKEAGSAGEPVCFIRL